MELQKLKSGPRTYSTLDSQVELVSLVLGCNLKLVQYFGLIDPISLRNFCIVVRVLILNIKGGYPKLQSLFADVACEFGVRPTTVRNVYYNYDNLLKVKSIVKENFDKLFC